jgi:hypothetical protein
MNVKNTIIAGSAGGAPGNCAKLATSAALTNNRVP